MLRPYYLERIYILWETTFGVSFAEQGLKACLFSVPYSWCRQCCQLPFTSRVECRFVLQISSGYDRIIGCKFNCVQSFITTFSVAALCGFVLLCWKVLFVPNHGVALIVISYDIYVCEIVCSVRPFIFLLFGWWVHQPNISVFGKIKHFFPGIFSNMIVCVIFMMCSQH